MPKFDWHNKKNKKNLKEHHVNFETASKIWEGLVLEEEDDRSDYGEERITAFGMVDNRVLAVTYTERDGGVYRLISARKATTEEREAYEEEFRYDS